MIRFKCTECEAEMESPDSMAGEMEKCPNCGAAVPRPSVKRTHPWNACKTKSKLFLGLVSVAKILAILLAYFVTGFLVSVGKISLLCLWNYQRLVSLPDFMEHLMLYYPELASRGMGYLIFAVAAGLIGKAVTRKSGITAAVVIAFISGFCMQFGVQYGPVTVNMPLGLAAGTLMVGLIWAFWKVSGSIWRVGS